MELAIAQKYSSQIVSWLAPLCDRIEVAGSVRRLRPICNDIDLVVIPKYSAPATDLFGQVAGARANHLHAHLRNYVCDANGAVWHAGENNPEGSNFILQLPKCQLDIYVATPENWGSKLAQRTGSKEHNIWLAARAKSIGMHWELEFGLTSPTRPTIGRTEEELYAALNLNFIPPEHREGGCLEKYIL